MIGTSPGITSIARNGSPNAPGMTRISARPIRCSVGVFGSFRPRTTTSSIGTGANGCASGAVDGGGASGSSGNERRGGGGGVNATTMRRAPGRACPPGAPVRSGSRGRSRSLPARRARPPRSRFRVAHAAVLADDDLEEHLRGPGGAFGKARRTLAGGEAASASGPRSGPSWEGLRYDDAEGHEQAKPSRDCRHRKLERAGCVARRRRWSRCLPHGRSREREGIQSYRAGQAVAPAELTDHPSCEF